MRVSADSRQALWRNLLGEGCELRIQIIGKSRRDTHQRRQQLGAGGVVLPSATAPRDRRSRRSASWKDSRRLRTWWERRFAAMPIMCAVGSAARRCAMALPSLFRPDDAPVLRGQMRWLDALATLRCLGEFQDSRVGNGGRL